MNMQMLVHIGLLYFVKTLKVFFFYCFGAEHVPEEIKEFVGNKNRKVNIFRVQASNLIMRGYFYIGFIDFILTNKNLTDFTSWFSPYDFETNDSIILSYFKGE